MLLKTTCIIFVLPISAETISDYVRAKCLRYFAPCGISFQYFDRKLNKYLNKKILREIFLILLLCYDYLAKYRKINNKVFYFIKPEFPKIIWIFKNITKCKVIIDINDPLHLFPWIGPQKLMQLLRVADAIIFESVEYYEYCVSNFDSSISNKSSIIEDTPQHEDVYDNQASRPRVLSWVGSVSTCDALSDLTHFFKKMTELGYTTVLLGASKEIFKYFLQQKIKVELLEQYSNEMMAEVLKNSQFTVVPMHRTDRYELRGNLKAKICMSYGSCVLASDNRMHRRLIVDGKTGFLIKNFDSLCLNRIIEERSEIGLNASTEVSRRYRREDHALNLSKVAKNLLRTEQ